MPNPVVSSHMSLWYADATVWTNTSLGVLKILGISQASPDKETHVMGQDTFLDDKGMLYEAWLHLRMSRSR